MEPTLNLLERSLYCITVLIHLATTVENLEQENLEQGPLLLNCSRSRQNSHAWVNLKEYFISLGQHLFI